MKLEQSSNLSDGGGSSSYSSKRIKVKPFQKSRFVIQLTLIMLAVITIFAFTTFETGDAGFFEGVWNTILNVRVMFFEAHFSHFTFWEAVHQVFITLGLAMLTTLFGAIVALFFSLFAAQNLSNKYVSNIIKGIVAFIRAVPTVLWVLIFAVAAGLGSVAAVIGMTFHTIGYLIKAFSESFEDIDHGILEALRSSGAGWWQTIFQAVLPSTITTLISWVFMRFEINFGVAIAMGAAAGAGGIGYDMFMASGFYFDLREVGTITYFILTLAIILEFTSTQIRARLSGKRQ
ncbi:ABC transporter permease subunit [Bacillaceae bacterium Marseille-Q3522]|nr:ABC transporter permease subunit [Bacillaceae bacterium Marseille-Q3522]